MKLQIGENLKKLRDEKGITQEQLSDVLGVSCQSVSRWELNVCYPDLELLPVIANYFDITLDDLLGMAYLRSEERRREIFTRALELERRENWQEAIAVLREAVRTYPNDDGILTELALVLTKTGSRQNQMEAITLSEKVLERCTGEKLRSTARANLCFLYKATGQTEKAVALGRALPHIWECREILLPDLVSDGERQEMTERLINIAFQVLRDVSAGKAIPFALGYKPEETVNTGTLRKALKENT